ncbi:hypothetical protein [Flammeovirga sp. EKP202]|uniref:hypothetical protein n=1 Tax=Flammeovirga sp. EKP202 TaxID=2770592 RepID=UPI00165FA23F|nr:hypothetical protein [Flammeovirga sp. EKP202]MBD0404086.1 hypothetical protein [Flammeovirga sp. EKP202]
MEIKDFVKIIKDCHPNLPPVNILKNVDFIHNGKEDWGESDDINADFRRKVVETLFDNKKLQSRELIKYLLQAEIDYCREETLMRETLRQITFMLYMIGKVEDIPMLFEAKMDTSFDAGCGLDIELIFGRDKDKVKEYFQLNKHENYDIVGCIEEYEKYDYQTPNEFIKGMKMYYES